jgi:two-component system, LytTR family, sensor kinase
VAIKEEMNKVMKKKPIIRFRIQILLHLLAWTILLLIPVYFIKRFQFPGDFLWLYYTNIIISGIIFYINYFLLVPRYFFQAKKLKYYLSVAVLFLAFYFVSDFSNQVIFKYISQERRTEMPPSEREDDKGHRPHGPAGFPMRPPFREMHLFNYGSTSLFLIFFSLGLRILERHAKIEKIQKELEKEKLISELALLKNQISPHFFFNTLNNIYSLVSINAEDSRKAILKLSKMMRYLLYETEHGNTKLSNEIDFMTNYIDLMKLRMSEKIALSVSFPESYDDVSIPPLLFIPFIENAFKHGISFRDNSFVNIAMTCTGGQIDFLCSNSIASGNKGPEENSSGIGLGNVK